MAIGKQTTRLAIQIGDGGDPETFAHMCGANAWEVTFTNNLGEDAVLDCDAPLDTPATIVRYLQTQDTQLSISGMVTIDAFPAWREWADGGIEKNVKIILDEAAADNGGFWTLPAYLTEFKKGKESSGKVTFEASIVGAGQRVWTDAA